MYLFLCMALQLGSKLLLLRMWILACTIQSIGYYILILILGHLSGMSSLFGMHFVVICSSCCLLWCIGTEILCAICAVAMTKHCTTPLTAGICMLREQRFSWNEILQGMLALQSEIVIKQSYWMTISVMRISSGSKLWWQWANWRSVSLAFSCNVSDVE